MYTLIFIIYHAKYMRFVLFRVKLFSHLDLLHAECVYVAVGGSFADHEEVDDQQHRQFSRCLQVPVVREQTVLAEQSVVRECWCPAEDGWTQDHQSGYNSLLVNLETVYLTFKISTNIKMFYAEIIWDYFFILEPLSCPYLRVLRGHMFRGRVFGSQN